MKVIILQKGSSQVTVFMLLLLKTVIMQQQQQHFSFCIGVELSNNVVKVSGERGLCHTYTRISSPPFSPPIQTAT